jgi:thioredoxin reductase
MTERFDVVVIGGGAAGLAGAVALSRSRRSVLVLDSGEPRNAPAGHVHNYLGREGTPPAELLATGRAELAGYGGTVRGARVLTAEPDGDGGFRVTFAPTGQEGEATTAGARRLLIATGIVDELPDLPGLAERWGRDVLHCPYCHGWEVRDQRIAVLACGPMATHQALLLRQLSDRVTLLRHDTAGPDAEQRAQLDARGIDVRSGVVTGLVVREDRLAGVRLDGGEVVACTALAVQPGFHARLDGLAGLGLPVAELRMGEHLLGTHLSVDQAGATAVAGVYAAGNVAEPMAQVLGAAAAGMRAGAALNYDLVADEVRNAQPQEAAR